ncbi:hypothetical protein L208DRAFT_1239830 [Tricholoma matsutake]|nr:hypothetical protein L208DRAFT_1239830 [Tricholoma matsutake 945]
MRTDPIIDSAASVRVAHSSSLEDDEPKAPSKSAMKKAAKAERYAAFKLERRTKEKEAKKAKRRLKAEKRAAGELEEEEEEANRSRKKRARLQFGGNVVIDLDFDKLMSEKEITSLCSQLAYTYSANRDAGYPFSLLFTSLNGRTYTRLEGMSDAAYKRWVNTEWWHESYERLWRTKGDVPQSITEADPSTQGDKENPGETVTPETKPSGSEAVQANVIYLTADSEEELTELKPEEIYIIGGICDHNRYKNLCLNKANDSDVRTARLPIGRYLASLPTRKVLTVNQVMEILLKWVETRNWEEAFYHVIPKRKFQGGVQAQPGSVNEDDTAEEPVVEQGDLQRCTRT